MNKIKIRTMQIHELKDIYKNIECDFPPNERPPFEMLEKDIICGVQKCLIGMKDI